MMRTRRLVLLKPGMLVALACLSLAISPISPSAGAQIPAVSRLKAAFTLRQNGTYDFGSRVVRCQAGQQIGIATESSESLVVTNVRIEGCEVGIISAGRATSVFDVDIRDTSVCMLITGRHATISNNKATQCTFGMVVFGDENTISANEVTDNTADGIVILGDANEVTGNRVLRNRGTGIHVVRTVPMIAEGSFFPQIQDLASGNVLQGNNVTNNDVDLEEFGDCLVGLANSWTDNQFGTKQPDCIR